MPQVLLLSGSPSAGSRTAALLRQVGERIVAAGVRVDALEVRDLPGQALLHADSREAQVARAVARVAAADAVVVGTPVYKAAYTGVLKAFLDVLPPAALSGKRVLPVVTIGGPAHALALDYALRPVLVALGADHVLPGVSVVDSAITPDGLGDVAGAGLWPQVDGLTAALLGGRQALLL